MHRRAPGSAASMLGFFAGLWFLMSLVVTPTHAAAPFSPARVAVYFSPNGGATEAVVRALHAAQTQVLMQAYSFTSASIAKALIEAHKRGVKILAVLDKSNETDKYSAATFLNNAGIQPLIDDKHAIAHAKVMVIDRATIITGSFHFTKAAEEKNAENLLVITEVPALVKVYEANIRLHAGHARPYQRQAALGSSDTAPVSVSGNGEVHGNKQSKIYHLPNCPGYTGMNPASVVMFPHEAAAAQAGYRKARHCP
jgi:PLD-like domain/Metal binding domain of Ada